MAVPPPPGIQAAKPPLTTNARKKRELPVSESSAAGKKFPKILKAKVDNDKNRQDEPAQAHEHPSSMLNAANAGVPRGVNAKHAKVGSKNKENATDFTAEIDSSDSDQEVEQKLCGCGCGKRVYWNQPHACISCKDKVYNHFCFAPDTEEGRNGVCLKCLRAQNPSSSSSSTGSSSSNSGSSSSSSSSNSNSNSGSSLGCPASSLLGRPASSSSNANPSAPSVPRGRIEQINTFAAPRPPFRYQPQPGAGVKLARTSAEAARGTSSAGVLVVNPDGETDSTKCPVEDWLLIDEAKLSQLEKRPHSGGYKNQALNGYKNVRVFHMFVIPHVGSTAIKQVNVTHLIDLILKVIMYAGSELGGLTVYALITKKAMEVLGHIPGPVDRLTGVCNSMLYTALINYTSTSFSTTLKAKIEGCYEHRFTKLLNKLTSLDGVSLPAFPRFSPSSLEALTVYVRDVFERPNQANSLSCHCLDRLVVTLPKDDQADPLNVLFILEYILQVFVYIHVPLLLLINSLPFHILTLPSNHHHQRQETGFFVPSPPSHSVDDEDDDMDMSLLSYHANDISSAIVCVYESLVAGLVLVKPTQRRKSASSADGNEAEAVAYSMSSCSRRRKLFEECRAHFVEDKVKLLRTLKKREDLVGFAEIKAARAATFALWETPGERASSRACATNHSVYAVNAIDERVLLEYDEFYV